VREGGPFLLNNLDLKGDKILKGEEGGWLIKNIGHRLRDWGGGEYSSTSHAEKDSGGAGIQKHQGWGSGGGGSLPNNYCGNELGYVRA